MQKYLEALKWYYSCNEKEAFRKGQKNNGITNEIILKQYKEELKKNKNKGE